VARTLRDFIKHSPKGEIEARQTDWKDVRDKKEKYEKRVAAALFVQY